MLTVEWVTQVLEVEEMVVVLRLLLFAFSRLVVVNNTKQTLEARACDKVITARQRESFQPFKVDRYDRRPRRLTRLVRSDRGGCQM